MNMDMLPTLLRQKFWSPIDANSMKSQWSSLEAQSLCFGSKRTTILIRTSFFILKRTILELSVYTWKTFCLSMKILLFWICCIWIKSIKRHHWHIFTQVIFLNLKDKIELSIFILTTMSKNTKQKEMFNRWKKTYENWLIRDKKKWILENTILQIWSGKIFIITYFESIVLTASTEQTWDNFWSLRTNFKATTSLKALETNLSLRTEFFGMRMGINSLHSTQEQIQ